MRRILLTCLLAATAALAPGCKTNPATGASELNFLGKKQEIALGEKSTPKFIKQYGGEIPSPAIRQYVKSIGQRLASVSERPNLPWEFHVVDSKAVNAFSLPGGKIFITRGLVSQLKNEAQLAGVLGHEIGHVNAEHVGQQMSRQMLLQAGLAGVGVAAQVSDKSWLNVLGAAGGVGGNLYLLHFSRGQENQADKLGVRYMTRLGYNPVGQVQVMKILKQEAGGGGGPEILSTHPLPQTRIKHLKKLISKKYPGYNNPQKYQFNQDRFHNKVLANLKGLPPPAPAPQPRQQPRQQPQQQGQ